MNICVVYLHGGASYCMVIDCPDITSSNNGKRSSVPKHDNQSGRTAKRMGAYCLVTLERVENTCSSEKQIQKICMCVRKCV